MKYLFSNLKQYWRSVILLAVLLVIQGFCEMSMPQYTQNIIDVGIQNKGIEHILPTKIKDDEFEAAQIFMDDDQKLEWKDSYSAEGDTYVLQDLSEDRKKQLDKDLLTPIVMAYQLGHMTEDSFKDMIKTQIQAMGEGQSALAASMAKKLLASIDTMSADQIADSMHLEITTFKARDEDGKEAVYVDVRPAMQQLIESGNMSQDQLSDMRKKISETVQTVGDRTMRAMAIRYAADTAEAAGVDVDGRQKSYLWSSGGRMVLMALLMAVAAVIVSYVASKVGAKVGRDLRAQVFGNVIDYSSAEMDKFQTSSLITRATNDVQQVQMVTTMLLRMVLYAPVLGIWGVIKVYQAHAKMSWIIFLGIAVIVSVIMTLMFFAMPKFKIMQKLVDKLNGVSREILTGLMVVRAFGREKTEEKRFDDANKDLMRTQLFTSRVMTFMMPSMMFIMSGLSVLITWVAAHRVDAGTLEVGAMTSFITYAMIVISSFMILTAMSVILPRAGVAAERIHEVAVTKSSILEPENPETPAQTRGVITFDHVNFRYPGAEVDALHDITFTAEPGKTTAIIGSTGCGKSTLVNLIPHFYDVTGGSITMDGIDLRKMDLHFLRDQIGFVPQKGTLFSGTIASNIRFGRPDAPDEEVKRAAEIAQADDFISDKEDGYDSYISQGGNNVSGGQKQRLSIARAIAKKPKVLVFDDSFSALDMKTDAKLRAELEKQEKDATRIIVAQRVSTILHADQILVIDEGRLAGVGTHAELVRNCEVYRQIASSQLSEKELEETLAEAEGKTHDDQTLAGAEDKASDDQEKGGKRKGVNADMKKKETSIFDLQKQNSSSAVTEADEKQQGTAFPKANTENSGSKGEAAPAEGQRLGSAAAEEAARRKRLEELKKRQQTSARHRGPGPGGHSRVAEKPKNFRKSFGKLVAYLGTYRIAVVVVMIVAAASTVFNVLGPKIMGHATTELAEGLMRKIQGTGGIDFEKIGKILIFTLILYVASAVLGFIQGWIMSTVSQKVAYRMRKEIARKIDRMPMKYFESRPIGDVLSRITNDVDTLGMGLNQSITTIITSVATLVGVVIMMLTISPLMTLIAVVVIPLSAFAVSMIVRKSQKFFKRQQESLGIINGQIEEDFSGQLVIKAFNREKVSMDEFGKTNQDLYDSAWKSQFISGIMMPVMNFVSYLGYAGVAISGGMLVIRGTIGVGDIQAFIQYVGNIKQPLTQMAQVINQVQSMTAAAERVFEFLDEKEEDQGQLKLTDAVTESDPSANMSSAGAKVRGEVDFDHVRFYYDPDQIVIKDFSAHVNPGQKIAIVGPTGAGKTTIVKLLMRFYDVNSGSIRLDGKDVCEYDRHELRDNFSMVLQDTWLFSGTIRENIRFGRLDATDEEVEKAAKAAHVDHFIRTLPGGYDMVLNEDATNVSQGQKQLLTIARAMLADRRVLILDEATSSVDTRTEQLIQSAMDSLMHGRTSFIIAHRLSTVRNADLILVLNHGDIVEQGTHDELLAKNGFYADIYNSQFAGMKEAL